MDDAAAPAAEGPAAGAPVGGGPFARKASTEENFPVASWLLPAALRPHVMAFYRFVRLADDIADDADLAHETKLKYLDALEQALLSDAAIPDEDWRRAAAVLHRSHAATGVADRFACQLLQAFRQDAINEPCRTWEDLIDYCRYSAMPVGRYLMALHGEDESPGSASDALCTALQILNHLQDCAEDWRRLRRLYLPLTWLQEEGIEPDDLLAAASSAALRRVLDRTLDGVDDLLVDARPLARLMRHRRLARESEVIVRLAMALRDELRRRDPLAERVEVGKIRRAWVGLGAVAAGLFR